MPRELVTVQVGQCGLQVGTKFWELALLEHRQYNRSGLFDESMSSFFRNVDTRFNPPLDVPMTGADGSLSPLATLKARAVLVDMEEGVLGELFNRGQMGDLFDERQTVHSVSGSGNNWAHGHCHYGPQYGASIVEAVRRQTEHCDSLQAFFLMHSLGGGTGSGLGTYILSQLEDQYADVYRFVTAVFPSDQDDVVTSPYNSMLSLAQLVAHADAVMPIHNQALMDICERINRPRPGSKSEAPAPGADKTTLLDAGMDVGLGGDAAAAARAAKRARRKAFDDMNTLAAQLLTSLTCSMRFEGPLNVDLNEITMNLVPFPRMHFLVSSLAPLVNTAKDNHALKFGGAAAPTSASSSSSSSSGAGGMGMGSDPRVNPLSYGASKSIDAMFTTLFQPESHLVKVNPRTPGRLYLACGLFGRGADLGISDMNRNIARMRREVRMSAWNEDGFKIGLCSTPPVGLRNSLLCLANTTAIAPLMSTMRERCMKMYSRRANFHHYLEYMEGDVMERALSTVDQVIADYSAVERESGAAAQAAHEGYAPQRIKPIG